jgi:hypothetical protein
MLPNKKQNLRRAFFKGAFLGPLAVMPATFLLFVISSSPFAILGQFARGMNSAFYIALWGTGIAYIMTFFYGTLLWLLLAKLKKLNLPWLLAGSLLPSVLLFIYNKSIGFTILCAYFSLTVSFSCWFFSVRKLSH